jgi:hypothetical protein
MTKSRKKFSGDYRLGLPGGSGVALVEHDGYGLLHSRRSTKRSRTPSRHQLSICKITRPNCTSTKFLGYLQKAAGPASAHPKPLHFVCDYPSLTLLVAVDGLSSCIGTLFSTSMGSFRLSRDAGGGDVFVEVLLQIVDCGDQGPRVPCHLFRAAGPIRGVRGSWR